MDAKIIINYITTFFVLLPISWGVVKQKPASLTEKSVLVLLIVGFAVDFAGMLFKSLRTDLVIWYAGLESLFFLLLIRHYIKNEKLRDFIAILSFAMLLLWFVSFFVFTGEIDFFVLVRKFYDMLYTLITACLSGFLLLQMIEEEEVIRKPLFWMVTAIFVYCFCAFFISAFIRDEVVKKIWYIHNLVTIVSSTIFTRAFSLIKPAQ